jgi:hypothetical protein
MPNQWCCCQVQDAYVCSVLSIASCCYQVQDAYVCSARVISVVPSFVLNYRSLQSLYYTLNLSIFHIKIELINFDSKIVENAYALLVTVFTPFVVKMNLVISFVSCYQILAQRSAAVASVLTRGLRKGSKTWWLCCSACGTGGACR